eukprot:gnl/TRDRNA2_/TRDRNA2_30345_c0_seq1.p1 gnl/TRDRNA2_/TRDRNA2_30345_c0~~gnl/TRDRNA2_/TRDRNA2_30345_c0_seq1.p1  ORF type:complete len:142 (-),score=19.75 gnl/TRDRNA2_/TRDRNA2_30345_c0_seq1:22-447(-)
MQLLPAATCVLLAQAYAESVALCTPASGQGDEFCATCEYYNQASSCSGSCMLEADTMDSTSLTRSGGACKLEGGKLPCTMPGNFHPCYGPVTAGGGSAGGTTTTPQGGTAGSTAATDGTTETSSASSAALSVVLSSLCVAI